MVYYNNTEQWAHIDALYFSAMTITTVGYGDLVPTTAGSKIFTIFYSIFGIGIMLYLLGSFAGEYMERHEHYFDKVIASLHHVTPKKLRERFRKRNKSIETTGKK